MRTSKINYLGQLVQKTENELLRTPDLGYKSLKKLKDILESCELRLGMEIDYTIPEER